MNGLLVSKPLYAPLVLSVLQTVFSVVDFFLDYHQGIFSWGEFVFLSTMIIVGNGITYAMGLWAAKMLVDEMSQIFVGFTALPVSLIWV
jgi:hypothetical protein